MSQKESTNLSPTILFQTEAWSFEDSCRNVLYSIDETAYALYCDSDDKMMRKLKDLDARDEQDDFCEDAMQRLMALKTKLQYDTEAAFLLKEVKNDPILQTGLASALKRTAQFRQDLPESESTQAKDEFTPRPGNDGGTWRMLPVTIDREPMEKDKAYWCWYIRYLTLGKK